jgi:uncharacterized protein YlxW (UPF0749 family)
MVFVLRLIDLTTRHRKECELETERLCSSQQQSERLLEARERAHRQQIKGLEEQVSSVQEVILFNDSETGKNQCTTLRQLIFSLI